MKRIRNKRAISLYRFTRENHGLTDDEITELEDLFLSSDQLPSGFYVIKPIKEPEEIEDIIDSYYPLMSLNNTTISIWLAFSRFIAPLDEITNNRLIDVKTMRFDSVCPDGFIASPFKVDRILGFGQQINLFDEGLLAISLNSQKMKEKIAHYQIKDETEIVEILSYCVYLLYYSTISIFDGNNMCIGKQWDTYSFHEHFVVYTLYGFIAHHPNFNFKTPLAVWAKFLRIDFNPDFLDKIENTRKESVSELIYHYCQYLDKHGNEEGNALNYALSKVTVNRFSL
jgi:hypothetical protein